MKKYFTFRPLALISVKWEGSNLEEFEEVASSNIWGDLLSFVVNSNNELEVYYDTTNLVSTLSKGQWYAGIGVQNTANPDVTSFQEIQGQDGPWRYDVSEETE
jgi:hypothetical protein